MILSNPFPLRRTVAVRLPTGRLFYLMISPLDGSTWVGWIDRGTLFLPNGRRIFHGEPVTAGTCEELLTRACVLAAGARESTGSA